MNPNCVTLFPGVEIDATVVDLRIGLGRSERIIRLRLWSARQNVHPDYVALSGILYRIKIDRMNGLSYRSIIVILVAVAVACAGVRAVVLIVVVLGGLRMGSRVVYMVEVGSFVSEFVGTTGIFVRPGCIAQDILPHIGLRRLLRIFDVDKDQTGEGVAVVFVDAFALAVGDQTVDGIAVVNVNGRSHFDLRFGW